MDPKAIFILSSLFVLLDTLEARTSYEDQLLSLTPKESQATQKSQAEVAFPLHFGGDDEEFRSNVLKRVKRKGGFSRGKGKGKGNKNKPPTRQRPTQVPPNSYPKQPGYTPSPAGYPKQPGSPQQPGYPNQGGYPQAGYPSAPNQPPKPGFNVPPGQSQPGYGYPGYGQPAGGQFPGSGTGSYKPGKSGGWGGLGGATGLGAGLAGGMYGGKKSILGKMGGKGGTGRTLGAGLLGAGIGLYAGTKLAKGLMHIGGFRHHHGWGFHDDHDHYHDSHGHFLGADGVYYDHHGFRYAHDARLHLDPTDTRFGPNIVDVNGTNVEGKFVRYYPYNATHGLWEYSKESQVLTALQKEQLVADTDGCNTHLLHPILALMACLLARLTTA